MKTLTAVLACALAAGAQPVIRNGQWRSMPGAALPASRPASAAWKAAAWSVPAAPFDIGCARGFWDGHDGPYPSDPSDRLIVMVEWDEANSLARRVQSFSGGCRIEAQGQAVAWFGERDARESAAWLSALVESEMPRDGAAQALRAIAVHSRVAAEPVLRRYVASTKEPLRAEAIFWLARHVEPAEAARLLRDAVDRDASDKVRERAVLGLSAIPAETGVPHLIEVAKRSGNDRVRRRAMFCLARSNDARAREFIESLLR